MLEQVRTDPAMPHRFGANQPGMQDKGQEHDAPVFIPRFLNQAYYEYKGWPWLDLDDLDNRMIRLPPREAWAFSVWVSSYMAEGFMNAGYHKQIGNRLIEPGQYINVLISSTEWQNFYDLRDHEAAEPSIRALAQEMRKVQYQSEPQLLGPGEWHLPYITAPERQEHDVLTLLKASTARCARLSYMTVEGKPTSIAKDVVLHDKLIASVPRHASPAEHQAKSGHPGTWYANFQGWKSYRWLIEHGRLQSIASTPGTLMG